MDKSPVTAKKEAVPTGSLPDKPSPNTIPNPRKKPKTFFSLNDLKQGCPLADMANFQFMLKYANPTNFYIYLMPWNSMFLEAKFKLKFTIIEWLKRCPEKLPSPPGIAHIVLAPDGDGENLSYLRALIVQMNGEGTFALVQYCDIGLHAWVEVSSMKPISAAIMEFPRLVYATVLAGFSVDDNNSILWSEYEAEIQKHRDKNFFIKIVSDSPDPKDPFSPTPAQVRLWYKRGSKTIDIGTNITKLQTWEWVKVTGLKGQDSDHWTKGRYGIAPGARDKLGLEKYALPRPLLPKHHCFKATFSKLFPAKLESKVENCGAASSELGKDKMSLVALVMLVVVDEQRYCNYLKLIKTQIERYCEHVKPTEKFPDCDFFLIRKKETHEWFRAMKIEGYLYLMDLDEYIPFTRFEDLKTRFDIRRPYWEFFKTPRMVLGAHIQSKKSDGLMGVDEAAKIFKKETNYLFRIIKPETASDFAEVSLEKA